LVEELCATDGRTNVKSVELRVLVKNKCNYYM
jgi:hypothetical protein